MTRMDASTSRTALARWHAVVESRDAAGLPALVAEDAVFRSPIVHKPYHGREAIRALLGGVIRVFEDFRYERAIGAPDSPDHALVFRARIGERELEGCDFLHENADGLIDEFVVMVRPLTAAHALAEGMRAHFEGAVPAP